MMARGQTERLMAAASQFGEVFTAERGNAG